MVKLAAVQQDQKEYRHRISGYKSGTMPSTQTNRRNNSTKNKKQPTLLSRTDIYSDAERRLSELEQVINDIEDYLAKAPEGKIHIVKSHGRIQYYLRKNPGDKSGRYMQKGDLVSISRYLQKSYNEKILKLLKQEAINLEKFLKCSDKYSNEIPKVYSNNFTEVKSLISPIDVDDGDYANWWLKESYDRKEIGDNVPCYETIRKERVRSKSELNIANALARFGVPYKYEHPLTLKNGMIIYPDFTVLNVKSRKEFYWEHRGMMDDREYARHSVARIKDYARDGIYTGKNLIITEETSTSPLGTNEIEAVIKAFLC